MNIGEWIKSHPYEAGAIGVVGLVVVYYFFFSGGSSSGSSDLSSYYNAQAASAQAGEQQQALYDELQAASQYNTTQAGIASTAGSTQQQIAQIQATAQTQQTQITAHSANVQAQAQAQSADVAARQATKLGVAQSNDALTAVLAGTSPAVLGSQNYQAFLTALTGGGTPAGGTATTGIYGQSAGTPGFQASLIQDIAAPGLFGAPGNSAWTTPSYNDIVAGNTSINPNTFQLAA